MGRFKIDEEWTKENYTQLADLLYTYLKNTKTLEYQGYVKYVPEGEQIYRMGDDEIKLRKQSDDLGDNEGVISFFDNYVWGKKQYLKKENINSINNYDKYVYFKEDAVDEFLSCKGDYISQLNLFKSENPDQYKSFINWVNNVDQKIIQYRMTPDEDSIYRDKENSLAMCIDLLEDSFLNSSKNSDLSGELYKQLVKVKKLVDERKDVSDLPEEIALLRKCAENYLDYKVHADNYNSRANGKIKAAFKILDVTGDIYINCRHQNQERWNIDDQNIKYTLEEYKEQRISQKVQMKYNDFLAQCILEKKSKYVNSARNKKSERYKKSSKLVNKAQKEINTYNKKHPQKEAPFKQM